MLDRARLLRREMTLPERVLWREIRGRRLGPRFRRQVAMEPHLPPRGGGGPVTGRRGSGGALLLCWCCPPHLEVPPGRLSSGSGDILLCWWCPPLGGLIYL